MIKNNTTIDQLVQVSEMNDLYILGTQEGTAKKYDVNILKSEIELQANSIGFDFNPSTTYAKDDYCVYNNAAYKFNKGHSGAWVAADVDRVYMLDETLSKIFVDDKNILDIYLMYSDSSLAVSNATVTIAFSDSTPSVSVQTDSSGKASATILRNKEFTVSVNDINGYITPTFGHYKTFNTKQKIYGIYKAMDTRSDASVTVHVDASYGVSSSAINGKALTAYIDGSYYYSANIMDNQIAFGAKQGGTVTVIFPEISEAKTPYGPDGSISSTNKNLGTTVTVDSANYSIQATYLSLRVPKPTITRDDNNLITITDDWSDSVIYYTTDLSDPTSSSNLYSNPFTSSESIKAIAVKANYLDSNISVNIGGIPSIYTQLQYLQSNGSQYIDTSIVAGSYPFNIQASIEHTALGGEQDFFGNWTGSIGFVYGANGTNAYFWTNNSWTPVGIQNNVKYTLNATVTSASSGRTLILNGTSYSNSQTSRLTESTSTIGLFSGRGNSIYSAAKGKIYYADIYVGGTLKGSFYPVLRTSDSKPGMFDLVTGHFFVNKGSGEFTYA